MMSHLRSREARPRRWPLIPCILTDEDDESAGSMMTYEPSPSWRGSDRSWQRSHLRSALPKNLGGQEANQAGIGTAPRTRSSLQGPRNK